MIRLEVWVDIKHMHKEGRSIREIARRTGLSRNTVRRYLRDETPPRYSERPPKPGILDAYKPLRAERRRLEELTVRFETAPGEQAQIDWSEFGRLPTVGSSTDSEWCWAGREPNSSTSPPAW